MVSELPAATGSRRAFACCGTALFVLITGTNLPSPLYAVYAQRFGFGPAVVTLIFAAYAGALLPALMLAGPAADAWGYRKVLVPGLGLALAGALLLGDAGGTGWLLLGRVVQGVALARTEPSGGHRRAALMASVATASGGGLGPVIAGACASWLPAPARTCYLVESAVLVVVAVAALAAVPASLGRTGTAWRVSLPRLPRSAGPAFAWACAVSFAGWAVTAVFLSVVPSYVRSLTGDHDLLVAGVSSGLLLIVAALVQPLASRADARLLQRAGLVILAAGLGALLAAGASHLLTLVITAAVVAGAGQGLAFMGAVRRASQLAPVQAHAAVISAFYVATYLGVGIPVVGVGLLAAAMTTTTAVSIFAAVAMAGSLLLAVPGQAR